MTPPSRVRSRTPRGPLDPIHGMTYVIGLDVGLKRDSTVATICHLEHGIVYVDRMAVWTGTRLRPVKLGDVEQWIRKAATEYRATVIVDPWQAAQLTERLRSRGVRIREFPFTAQSVGRIASTLYLLLRERALRLPDDPELIDELSNVRLRETSPGVLRMDHDAGRHDDRAIALALAAHRLVEKGDPPRPARVQATHAVLPDYRAKHRAPTVARHPSSFDTEVARSGIGSWDTNVGRAELHALLDRGRRQS